jgi:hypothetical protein
MVLNVVKLAQSTVNSQQSTVNSQVKVVTIIEKSSIKQQKGINNVKNYG